MGDEQHAVIPLGEFRDPALRYIVEGEDARVTAANETFKQLFDAEVSSMYISTVFDRFNKREATGDEDPLTHLIRGDRIGIRLNNHGQEGPFFARVLPSDGSTGYLIFSDLRDCPERRDTPDVDHVSSVISHDLRNPLDVAKAHLQAAQETGELEHLDAVADAHDRMERIIRDVLTLTHNDAVVDPSEDVAIETAARDAWESIDSGQAELTLSESLPTVTADPDRLQRVFENLFRNSVEHGTVDGQTESTNNYDRNTEDRSGTGNAEDLKSVTVSVCGSADGFHVVDDGTGIPPAERDVVFEAGNSTRDGGTGLGLAIVKQIIEAHGWELTLTDADSGGARFEVSV